MPTWNDKMATSNSEGVKTPSQVGYEFVFWGQQRAPICCELKALDTMSKDIKKYIENIVGTKVEQIYIL